MSRLLMINHDAKSTGDLVQMLKPLGYEVSCYASYYTAEAELNSGRRIDLLLTRLSFPKGSPSGVSIARMTRIKRHDVPILFLTKTPSLGSAARRTGLGPVLLLPTDSGTLLKTIEMLTQAAAENQLSGAMASKKPSTRSAAAPRRSLNI